MLSYLQITHTCLKVELQRKLDLPPRLAGRGGNLAERGSAEEYSGRIERRRVQEVEELRPELERLILLHHPLLVDGRIPVAQTLRVNP
jgi:hypothetical protein